MGKRGRGRGGKAVAMDLDEFIKKHPQQKSEVQIKNDDDSDWGKVNLKKDQAKQVVVKANKNEVFDFIANDQKPKVVNNSSAAAAKVSTQDQQVDKVEEMKKKFPGFADFANPPQAPVDKSKEVKEVKNLRI